MAWSPRVQPRTGFAKDALEIESYVRGLGRRRPDVAVTTLRLANLMGAGVDSQLARFLALPVVPRVMGFDFNASCSSAEKGDCPSPR